MYRGTTLPHKCRESKKIPSRGRYITWLCVHAAGGTTVKFVCIAEIKIEAERVCVCVREREREPEISSNGIFERLANNIYIYIYTRVRIKIHRYNKYATERRRDRLIITIIIIIVIVIIMYSLITILMCLFSTFCIDFIRVVCVGCIQYTRSADNVTRAYLRLVLFPSDQLRASFLGRAQTTRTTRSNLHDNNTAYYYIVRLDAACAGNEGM
jgi:flagellar basal body-associated protein FliL